MNMDNDIAAVTVSVNSYNIQHDLMRQKLFNEQYYYHYNLFTESQQHLIELYGFNKYIDLIFIVTQNTH
jgi:hypothetical protein